MNFKSLAWLLLLCSRIIAQINVADSYEPYEPIIVGCSCIVPEDADVQFHWTVDDRSKAIETDSNQLYVWAPPGEHFVQLLVIKQFYEEIQVFVPNPSHPEDPTKAILKTVKVAGKFETERYEKGYRVGKPGPEPEPDPGPGPDPSPGGWDEIISKAPDKSKVQDVAGNYSSVGSQMSDPARNGSFNYQSCSQMVAAKHREVLGSSFGQWSGFFSALAEWQIDYVKENNIDISSNPSSSEKLKIGKMYTLIGEGLSSAN